MSSAKKFPLGSYVKRKHDEDDGCAGINKTTMGQNLLSKFLLMSVDLTSAEVLKLYLYLVQQRFVPSPVPLFTSPTFR